MQPVTLHSAQARKIILHAAGLARRSSFGKGREAVYKVIQHLGFVQVDTNYTVERAHHHVIFSRVPGYRPEWLGELQADGRVFEFFTSDSGFIPMEDYRYSLPVKESLSGRKPLTPADIHIMNKVLDRVGREGPLMVKDFANDRVEASMGWWDWRPSKVALERLFMAGRLMVTRSRDFQRIYDLAGNLVPVGIDRTMPSPEEFARHVIRRTLRSLGIAHVREMAWRARFVKGHSIRTEVEKMVAGGEVCRVTVGGLSSAPLYMLPEYRKKKIELSGEAFVLSPWDPLNVFRHRLRDFFGFDYQIECFVPEARRKYGYFSLPVLVGDRFVARMDSKADRKEKVLVIHNLHFEPVKMEKDDIHKFAGAVRDFAAFNGCRGIEIKKTNNRGYARTIREELP
ncbi:MAG TPA: crosslink repair DNA glycosylase YcaQ family protein [Puia sp.]|nr:crosslink repair DNA glycosylase YcaQ family protein [Puia sp.]